MEFFAKLNKMLSIPFVVISQSSLRINFFGDEAKKLFDTEKELKLSDVLNYESSLEDAIIEKIEPGQIFDLKNHESVKINKKYKIDEDNWFLSFTIINQQNHQFEKAKKEAVFKQILLKLSTGFISVSIDNMDDSVNNALKILGEFSNVDRCYVFKFSEDLKFQSNIYEWCRKGFEPYMEKLQNTPVSKFQYNTNRMFAGIPVVVNDISELPEEAVAEKEEYITQGIKSIILLPLIYQNKPIGFIGYDCCTNYRVWTEDYLYALKIVGDIITGAIVREKAEKKLKISEERYRGIFEKSGLSIFHLF